jgi:hypothetical protein
LKDRISNIFYTSLSEEDFADKSDMAFEELAKLMGVGNAMAYGQEMGLGDEEEWKGWRARKCGETYSTAPPPQPHQGKGGKGSPGKKSKCLPRQRQRG